MKVRPYTLLGPLVALTAAFVAVTPISAVAAATHATGIAASATRYQNTIIDAAMARHPGGTRISAGEVEWDGRIFMAVGASPTGQAVMARRAGAAAAPDTAAAADMPSNCPSGNFCGYNAPGFTGSCQLDVGKGLMDFPAFCGDEIGTWSWANNNNARAWKIQYYDIQTNVTSGNTWCINPFATNSDVTDTQTRDDAWMQATTNQADCG